MKGISREESKTMLQGVMDMGQASGVDINYNVVKNANTKDAHRVLQYAKELGKDSEYFERLYKAHFSEGQVISDRETIISLAGDVGIDSTKV
ncbi:MAG: DsbA family oxidoreductase, partial [Clostridiales bacterium]|nr:DsbA family oxidoreductase [Clostridiales bacterium]